MKKSSFQPVRNKFRLKTVITVFLLNLIILAACKKDRLIIDRVQPVRKVGSSELYAYGGVLPPRPDTHVVERSFFKNYSELQVDYSTSIAEKENSAKLTGANDEILSTAKIETIGEPVIVSNKPVYHMRAVFQLDKAAQQSILKVSLPNSTAVSDSIETFFIKIK